mgnify:CR=1 FL=1
MNLSRRVFVGKSMGAFVTLGLSNSYADDSKTLNDVSSKPIQYADFSSGISGVGRILENPDYFVWC